MGAKVPSVCSWRMGCEGREGVRTAYERTRALRGPGEMQGDGHAAGCEEASKLGKRCC